MILAIYARKLDKHEAQTLNSLREIALQNGLNLVYHKVLKEHLKENLPLDKGFYNTPKQLLSFKPSAFISIGGDGTLLDSILYVKSTNIPVLGINTGRLGFLSNTSPNALKDALFKIAHREFDLEERTVLSCEIKGPQNHSTFSLNDISIHKRDTSSMITVNCFLNGDHFNTYWADGLLVSTPTGSTAYSLSCGGPIMFPDAKSFLITPVAPHNLNVRPIIVSDDAEIKLVIEGRGENFLMAFDSRNKVFDYQSIIHIKKADFKLKLIKFKGRSFVSSLQEKLNWGRDNRNLSEQDTFI